MPAARIIQTGGRKGLDVTMGKKKFICPQCGVPVKADEKAAGVICPACGFAIGSAASAFGKDKATNDWGINVIKYEGDNSTFIWKHPVTDFNFGTTLIVHESQEAVFFRNGQALDSFGPGRHVLKTDNLPLIKQILRIPTGGADMFHAEIYFINRTVQMGIKWGTPDRVRFIEPETKIPLDLGASGDMNLMVQDPKKLLVKLVGTTGVFRRSDVLDSTPRDVTGRAESSYSYDSFGNRVEGAGYGNSRNIRLDGENREWANALEGAFRSMVVTTVKSNLARLIRELNINILEIDAYLDSLSDALGQKVSAGFEEYGLTVAQFYVTNVSLPEDDQNFMKIRELIAASSLGKKEAEVQADIVRAKREVELEKGTTENELTRLAAEREVIRAQGEAEKLRLEGLAEADVMRAQGYDKKDVLQAEVQKAYAEGMGKMGSNGSGGSGGGVMGDVIGLGVGMAAAGKMGEQFKNIFGESDGKKDEAPDRDLWTCSCGFKGNAGRFCSGCGKPKTENWDCPDCGFKGNIGKFCSGCGKPKTENWDCPDCGFKGNVGKFCSGCGKPKQD